MSDLQILKLLIVTFRNPLNSRIWSLSNCEVRLWQLPYSTELGSWIRKQTPQSPGKFRGLYNSCWWVVVVIHSLSHVQLFATPWTVAPQAFPVSHYLPEVAQIHVHWISDAIQPSHPFSPPSPLALNFYQHQGLFQWVSCLHQVAKLSELQHQSF